MGQRVEAKCLNCGAVFTLNLGGGFSFHLLRCNKCGKEKTIGFDELGELHLRYLKGLKSPYSVASSSYDRYVQEIVDVEPISEKEYYKGVEEIAGKCSCGGNFKFDAPPRCPKCRSTKVEKTKIITMYD